MRIALPLLANLGAMSRKNNDLEQYREALRLAAIADARRRVTSTNCWMGQRRRDARLLRRSIASEILAR